MLCVCAVFCGQRRKIRIAIMNCVRPPQRAFAWSPIRETSVVRVESVHKMAFASASVLENNANLPGGSSDRLSYELSARWILFDSVRLRQVLAWALLRLQC